MISAIWSIRIQSVSFSTILDAGADNHGDDDDGDTVGQYIVLFQLHSHI